MKPFAKYYLALGEFVDIFAAVEAAMQKLLWQESKIDADTARALFSGVRALDAMKYVRRIYESQARQLPKGMQDIFHQLGQINSIRNDIIHYGAEFDDEGRPTKITNLRVAHMPERVREHPISARILLDLIADLDLIEDRLIYFRFEAAGFTYAGDLDALFGKPWQYKPAQQSRPQKKRQAAQGSGKGRKRRPPSSRA